ncbi:MAG: hypothetical protein F9K29_08185 [Hyphomicrobiaceae bacterium]|nr:MAG: hypothetical protein F9K29_08185 [Hyphomicrobiaceae bacterium]
MATLEELQTRLAALKKALASGHKSVSYGEHRVDYRSIDELKAALLHVESDIAALSGRRVVRGYRFVSDKAL